MMPANFDLCDRRIVDWATFDIDDLVYACVSLESFFLRKPNLGQELRAQIENCRLNNVC